MKQLFLLSILAPLSLNAQTLSELDWLSGYWSSTSNGTSMEELWMAPSGGMMAGLHRDVFSNGRSSFEFLRIVETKEGIVYLASPGGQAPTPFTLTKTEGRKVIFENPEHDFPQRIIYSREDDRLTARIEDESGKKGMQWTWTKTSFDN